MAILSADYKLRVAQVLTMALAVTSGLATAIGMGWTTYIFNYSCILNGQVYYTVGENSTVSLDKEQTRFASIRVCHFCTFAPVVVTIYTVMWFWFFMFLSDWQKGDQATYRIRWASSSSTTIKRLRRVSPPDSRLMGPTVVLGVILWICCLVSLYFLSDGISSMCSGLFERYSKSCYEVAQLNWDEQYDVWMVYVYLKVAQTGNWILVLSLALSILIVIARLCLWNTQRHEWEVTGRGGGYFHSPAPSETLIPPNNSDTEETCFNALQANACFFNQSFTSPKDLTERFGWISEEEGTSQVHNTRRCNTL